MEGASGNTYQVCIECVIRLSLLTAIALVQKCLILCHIYRLIYEKFLSADVNKKENSVGIQLMGIVLANKISPFRPGCGVDVER